MSSSKRHKETSEIAKKALTNARHYVSRRNYGLAFVNLLLVGELEPSLKTEIESDFILTAREWTEELIKTDRIEHLFACYSKARQTFPESGDVFNNIGAQLFRLGYVEEAIEYIRKAVRLNPKSIGARDNFENICGFLVERWHFRMLNDVCRNQAYRSALQRSIVNGWSSVLDIGTGTGLLSMLAVDAGASSVYACEMSKTMFSIAKEVLSVNRKDSCIHLINKASTDLSIPEDLPCRVSLIVTETFDAALFGEHILSTLSHAWEHLLKKWDNYDNTRVIPANAQVFVCGIECDGIRNQNRFGYPCVSGVDCSQVDVLSDTGVLEDEPYTTENLTSISGGFKQITEPTPLLSVNFNDPQNIADLIKGVSEVVTCPILMSGRLDALAVWFDLHLDEVTTISTSPASENCWHQAIYPVFSSHLYPKQDCEKSVYIQKGDNLKVEYVCQDDKLTVRCSMIEENRSPVAKIENISPSVISEEIVCETTPVPTPEQLDDRESEPVITPEQLDNRESEPVVTPEQLDDRESEPVVTAEELEDKEAEPVGQDGLETSSRSNHQSLFLPVSTEQICSKSSSTCEQVSISDYKIDSTDSCTLPPNEPSVTETSSDGLCKSKFHLSRNNIGMLNDMSLNRAVYHALEQSIKRLRENYSANTPLTLLDMSHGFSCVGLQAINLGFSSVRLFSQSYQCLEREILTRLSRCNGIDESRFQSQHSYMEAAKDEDRVQCIFVDLIEPSGVLYQQVLEDLALLKVTCLDRDGIVLPAGVSVYGLLIESHKLEASSRVIGDKMTLGYHIKDITNEFQMSTFMDIELSALSHRRLSQPFLMLNLKFNEHQNQSSAASADPLDEVPSFLTAEEEIAVVVTEPGDLTAIVFWFDVHYTDDITLSTLNTSTHWKQAAIVLESNQTVQADQVLQLNVSLKNSCIRIKPRLPESGISNGDRDSASS